jgi:hypothetical protein
VLKERAIIGMERGRGEGCWVEREAAEVRTGPRPDGRGVWEGRPVSLPIERWFTFPSPPPSFPPKSGLHSSATPYILPGPVVSRTANETFSSPVQKRCGTPRAVARQSHQCVPLLASCPVATASLGAALY